MNAPSHSIMMGISQDTPSAPPPSKLHSLPSWVALSPPAAGCVTDESHRACDGAWVVPTKSPRPPASLFLAFSPPLTLQPFPLCYRVSPSSSRRLSVLLGDIAVNS
ncbi:hypothetical protein FSOLCH5_007274 [Fusarium solani]